MANLFVKKISFMEFNYAYILFIIASSFNMKIQLILAELIIKFWYEIITSRI